MTLKQRVQHLALLCSAGARIQPCPLQPFDSLGSSLSLVGARQEFSVWLVEEGKNPELENRSNLEISKAGNPLGVHPGKNTGVGCYFLLHGIFLMQGSNPRSSALHRWGNSGNSGRLLFFWARKSLQMVIAAMKLKDAYSLEGKL